MLLNPTALPPDGTGVNDPVGDRKAPVGRVSKRSNGMEGRCGGADLGSRPFLTGSFYSGVYESNAAKMPAEKSKDQA